MITALIKSACTARIAVLIADGRLHAACYRGDRPVYTAERIDEPTLAARRRALQAACHRLGVRRGRIAVALPEAHLLRRRLKTPPAPRNQHREHAARLRLLIRRHLPKPVSTWRYCLESAAPSPSSQRQAASKTVQVATAEQPEKLEQPEQQLVPQSRLKAVRQRHLLAAQRLPQGTGLRTVQLISTRDALRAFGATRLRAARRHGLPKTAAAALCVAVAWSAHEQAATNLLTAQPTIPPPPRSELNRSTLLGALVLVGALALFIYTHGTTLPGAVSGHTTLPPGVAAASSPTSSADAASGLELLASADATPGDFSSTATPHQRAWAAAGDLHRNLTTRLAQIDAARPAGVWLHELRFGDGQLLIQAEAEVPSQLKDFVAALEQAGFESVQIERLTRRSAAASVAATNTNTNTSSSSSSSSSSIDHGGNNKVSNSDAPPLTLFILSAKLPNPTPRPTQQHHNATHSGASTTTSSTLTTLSTEASRLAAELEAHGIELQRLDRRDGEHPHLDLSASGRYAAIAAWLEAVTSNPRPVVIEALRLRRDAQRPVLHLDGQLLIQTREEA
ncbi:hypothetical protein CKO15_05415 [Halorhodospira abdelmalekii]|uniref:hypothetical protein n=1 Tax=Halorhodospira abdelmalekii TaxID=421629 RepID=UPI001903DEE6|nr:hypothetical protein [Halorhodospira abdelmalekii]MBK1734734.1 hypothetical protein [Halorhodospira abdelmalekii]